MLCFLEPTTATRDSENDGASRKLINRVFSFIHSRGPGIFLALPLFRFFSLSLGNFFFSPILQRIFSQLFIWNVKDALRTLISSETFHFRAARFFYRVVFFLRERDSSIAASFLFFGSFHFFWFSFFFPDFCCWSFPYSFFVCCRRTHELRSDVKFFYRYFYCLATESVSRPQLLRKCYTQRVSRFFFFFPPPTIVQHRFILGVPCELHSTNYLLSLSILIKAENVLIAG